jgi:hypothetical protein
MILLLLFVAGVTLVRGFAIRCSYKLVLVVIVII